MSNFSAFIPADRMAEANASLEEQGFGPGNFSVPVKTAEAAGADMAALHCWSNPAFQAAVEALGYATVQQGNDAPGDFVAALETEALALVEWDGVPDSLPMKGDVRTYDGKEWVSLVDYNGWLPPVNWREQVEEGLPAWVQPTGAGDAYPVGFEVTHAGKDWRSTTPANVWEPGVFGWVEINVPAGQAPAPWSQQTYALGERVTFEGSVYESLIANNVWSPTGYPAGWRKV